MDSQQDIHNEVLKGIEQQENCCFELQSGFDSVKDQIESKANLFDLASKALFGIDWTSIVQMLVKNLTGRLIFSFSITIAFSTFYLMGSYYIQVHSIYSQKKEGTLAYKQRTFLVLAYFARYSFSFAIPSAWFICLSYTIFSPKKVTIFEMFTTLTKSDFNSPVIPIIGNKTVFHLFKVAQFFVLPLRGAIVVIGIVCAYFKFVCMLKDPGLFLYLFFTTFSYYFARQKI